MHNKKTRNRKAVAFRSFGLCGLFLLSAIGLSACSIYYGGIVRRAELQKMPSLRCIEKAIGAVPGVKYVTLNIYHKPGKLFGSGPLYSPQYYFEYITDYAQPQVYDDYSGKLFITNNPGGKIEFDHYFSMFKSSDPAPARVMRPIMLAVEDSIENRCGVSLKNNVIEECENVECR